MDMLHTEDKAKDERYRTDDGGQRNLLYGVGPAERANIAEPAKLYPAIQQQVRNVRVLKT